MTIAVMADFFNNLINTCIREIDPMLKGFLIIFFVCAAFFCLSKVLKPKAKADQSQINVGWLVLSILFFGLMMLYIFF